MEKTVEERLTQLEQDVAVIRSNYVTKEDLQKAMLEMTWRVLGFMAMLTSAVYFIARYVH